MKITTQGLNWPYSSFAMNKMPTKCEKFRKNNRKNHLKRKSIIWAQISTQMATIVLAIFIFTKTSPECYCLPSDWSLAHEWRRVPFNLCSLEVAKFWYSNTKVLHTCSKVIHFASNGLYSGCTQRTGPFSARSPWCIVPVSKEILWKYLRGQVWRVSQLSKELWRVPDT